MRILFWQEAFWPQVGGVPTYAESLLPALRERGHDIVVVTRHDTAGRPHADRWNGFAVHRFPFWQALQGGQPRAVLALQREVDQLLADICADVVHLSGFGPSALFALQAKRSYPAPLLLTLHSSNTFTAKHATLFEQTLRRAHWISAGSRALLDSALRCVPAIAGRSSVVYHGVATPAVTPAPLPQAPPRVLCLGHLADHKGYDLVLRSAPRVIALFPTLRIVLAGDGPARTALEQQARAAGIGATVEFPGLIGRAEVADLINSASIVVMPSRRESFGLVAVEAALLQRPVVAARVGGLPEIVVHDETGLLVAPDDSAALAEAIISLLSQPRKAELMGTRARERAQRRFARAPQCDAYEEIYQRIRAGASSHTATGAEVSGPCG